MAEDDQKEKKKAKRAETTIFHFFEEHQVAEFKEAFRVMDKDGDGIISKKDLKRAFEDLGLTATYAEVDEMLTDGPTGPLNFTMLLNMFATALKGNDDDDETITKCIEVYDVEGKIDPELFRKEMLTGLNRLSKDALDAAFEEMKDMEAFDINGDGKIDTKNLIEMLTSSNLD